MSGDTNPAVEAFINSLHTPSGDADSGDTKQQKPPPKKKVSIKDAIKNEGEGIDPDILNEAISDTVGGTVESAFSKFMTEQKVEGAKKEQQQKWQNLQREVYTNHPDLLKIDQLKQAGNTQEAQKLVDESPIAQELNKIYLEMPNALKDPDAGRMAYELAAERVKKAEGDMKGKENKRSASAAAASAGSSSSRGDSGGRPKDTGKEPSEDEVFVAHRFGIPVEKMVGKDHGVEVPSWSDPNKTARRLRRPEWYSTTRHVPRPAGNPEVVVPGAPKH